MILFGQKDLESSQVSNATQDKERKIIIKSFASNSQRSEKSQVRHWAKLKKIPIEVKVSEIKQWILETI